MRGFLHEVAEDLYGRYGDKIAELSVLFPSRRARHFFTDALSAIAERPLWQPEWLTVDELMCELSELREGDRVRLITELYKIYKEYHDEPFDAFYFWGEMLLNDFDTIDKYMIDADRLFRNITDLKELEADLSYLTPNQLEILRSFWSTLVDRGDLSEEKQRFLAVWRTLRSVYHRFRARLTEMGIGYTGMIQRAAAERIGAGTHAFARKRQYVVAGFNALSECEKRLFKALNAETPTDFYWDYDTYYLKNTEQEAGLFVRENLRAFPPRTELSHDHLATPKHLTTVAASSNAVQCKQVACILDSLRTPDATGHRPPLDKRTAVVLTDENLLLPLLYALPADAGRVNVTMGYPLSRTLAYTFIDRLIELQKHRRCKGFYHTDVTGLLAHPFIEACDPALTTSLREQITADRRIMVETALLARNEFLALIFSAAEDYPSLAQYLSDTVTAVAAMPCDDLDHGRRTEFLALIAEHIAKLRNSLDGCDVKITAEVFASLLRRTLRTLRVPFEGEPLEGLQVMGILETRNLDFENVIILSMTDDNFPGNLLSQSSFIPYNLRTAYALPTPEHHEGVYAYYFYRLIQRASNVWMLYCSHADEKSTGEPSRYIRQLDYESGFPLRKVEVGVDVNLAPPQPIRIVKDEAMMRRLGEFTTASESLATLSPTAFSRYVACPLKFYFYSVARIRSDDEVTEEVDNPLFGTILHDAVQCLYEQVIGMQHPGAALAALAQGGAVERAVREAIGSHCLHDASATEEEYSGNLLIINDIIVRYIRDGILQYDASHDTFAVLSVEQEVTHVFAFESAGRILEVKFSGRADRIDSLDDGALRVVDYKTGTPHLDYRSIDLLFEGKAAERLPNILQTLLYAMMIRHAKGRDTEPALYYVREMHREEYAPAPVNREHPAEVRYDACRETFEAQVHRTLAELYDPAIPFVQCDDSDTCKYCDFAAICRR